MINISKDNNKLTADCDTDAVNLTFVDCQINLGSHLKTCYYYIIFRYEKTLLFFNNIK